MRSSNSLCWAALVFFVAASTASAQETDHQQHQHGAASVSSPQNTTPPGEETASEAEHVAPDPPEHVMSHMTYASMVSIMEMDDTAHVGRVLLDQLEWRDTDGGDAAVWDAQAWYGGDRNKVFVKTEGEQLRDTTEEARAELLWDHVFARWWSVQTGLRHDFGIGPARTWAALGVEGLAPYWFDVDATLYVGDAGRTAMRFDIDYDLLITQRLILRTEVEANLYGKADPERQLGSGLSDAELALRLRYEIRREFAPYVGIAWQSKFSGTADYARAAGKNVNEAQAIAGVRIWF